MKAIVVYGSNRSNSTSKAVVTKVLEGAKAAGYDEIIEFDSMKMNFKGCINCATCKKNGIDCILNDDLKDFFKEIHTADALIVSSPNYMSSIAGPMITFMNRHCCMKDKDGNSRLGKDVKLISVYSQGAPVELEQYEKNYEWYHKCLLGMGYKDAGKFVVRGPMPAEDAEIWKAAFEAGKAL